MRNFEERASTHQRDVATICGEPYAHLTVHVEMNPRAVAQGDIAPLAGGCETGLRNGAGEVIRELHADQSNDDAGRQRCRDLPAPGPRTVRDSAAAHALLVRCADGKRSICHSV